MSSFNVNGFTFNQGIGELKAGYAYGDYSRISAYNGDLGLHTGANSPTVGRHNTSFGISSGERQTTLQEFGFIKGF